MNGVNNIEVSLYFPLTLYTKVFLNIYIFHSYGVEKHTENKYADERFIIFELKTQNLVIN